jgi:tetratricopeptide (TPR) repeat protein
MWSRRFSNWGTLLATTVLAAACSTAHVASTGTAATAPPAPVSSAPVAPAVADAPAGPVAPAAAPAGPVAQPPPPRAVADFARAVQLLKSGKDGEAELAFQQLASGYPAYPGALVNLGLLYRKRGDLARSEQSLQAAVQRDGNDAEGWSELGVTLRMEGKFHEAADAYKRAIGANPNYAPAYRNLAIVLDLYLGDTAAALTAMEHYKELAADDKAATGWIADLKQRAGKNTAAPGAAAPPATDKAGE